MPHSQTNCPRCRNPIVADITQLFDMNQDPTAKQRLLSGAFNLVRCPNCGYEGTLSSPIVYHDPDKELLLTYFPSELGLPANEQERIIGPLIKQVTEQLPAEKRKSYLLTPKTMLTMQGLMETILEADGITREMIQEQQKQINLLQRILTSPDDQRKGIIHSEEALINEQFFLILNRLIDASLSNGDDSSAKGLAELQQLLFSETEVGRRIQVQAKETEQVVKSLQEASKDGLTREKLLDMVIKANGEAQLSIFVSLARNGMDYQFFQILSDKIESAKAEEKDHLVSVRDTLLQLTHEMDEEINKRVSSASQMLEKILGSDNVEEATKQNLQSITSIFIEVLGGRIEEARKSGDLAQLEKLQKVAAVIQEATTPPPELQFIQELLDMKDEADVKDTLEKNSDRLTQEFLSMLNNVVMQAQSSNDADQESISRLMLIHKTALAISMRKNISQ